MVPAQHLAHGARTATVLHALADLARAQDPIGSTSSPPSWRPARRNWPAHSDNRRLTDRAEIRVVRAELTAERQRFADERDRLCAQARQAKAEADTATAAEPALQLTRADLQQARRQLATAQPATGLAVPDLADLADELGAGVSGVLLPEAAITAVTRHPDGTVALYHQGGQIPLGATTSDPRRWPPHCSRSPPIGRPPRRRTRHNETRHEPRLGATMTDGTPHARAFDLPGWPLPVARNRGCSRRRFR